MMKDTDGSHPVVLVVEDNIDIRQITSEVLEELGYSVICAENGYEGLQKLRLLNEPPCTILLDLMMPVMNGMQFLEHVEKDRSLPQVPIVVVSAIADECPQSPLVTSYIKKPSSIDELMRVLRQHCASG